MVEVYTLHMDRSLNNDEMNMLSGLVTAEKRERLKRFHFIADAQRTLLGDVLSRYAICRRLGIKNHEIAFRNNEYGKPILLDPHAIHFNISHSGDRVVCAIDEKPVGIDVEVMKPIDFKIAERFFSKEEYYALLSHDDEKKLRFFYTIWTLKESYIKAEGKGLSIPLDSFIISVNEGAASISDRNGPVDYKLKFFDSGENHIMATCTKNDLGSITRFDLHQFCREICLCLETHML